MGGSCGRRWGNPFLARALAAVVLAVLATVSVACGGEESAASAPTATDTATVSEPVSELPVPVSGTRKGILNAAESGDYELLRPLVNPEVFLSDFGFGSPDPVGRWRELGPEPLETMAVLLRMTHTVRETNEGTLYEWPRFGADSRAEDMSPAERELLGQIMSEAELKEVILPEVGYTGPRLGILADGTWWFFILEGEA
jgi:hypothetical protein